MRSLQLDSARVLVAAAAIASLRPAAAEACGGTFCDAGPQVMPVDQTGESIIFWIDEAGGEPHTEAHIQIQYEGEAEDFAWIIPVSEVPEVGVGSQALFANMLGATVPTFTLRAASIGDCGSGFGFGCALEVAQGDGVGFGTFTTGGDGDGKEGSQILDRGFAGAFEYVTLTGDNVQEVVDWLEQNGYAQDDDAPPILQEYLDEGFVFVAVKLRGGAGVDEIHPLTIRYPGTEPCIPIRLTRIAAVDDTAIRAFFLGDDRVASQNWPHVEINLSRLDWVNGPTTNYEEIVGLAIDEAGGRAFVTEYAGTSAVVSTARVFESIWDAAAFQDIAAVGVVDELEAQGLVDCDGAGCVFTHPQVESLLRSYLPAPAGIEAEEFWRCLECYAGLIDELEWAKQPGFAAEFEERITGPGQHALDMLASADDLTRLFTLLSPHEMIEDPLFHETSGLPTVDNTIVATRVNDCRGPSFYELPDGRRVALVDGLVPELEGNPAALRIERIPMTGPAQVEVDNAEDIDALLDEHNEGLITGPSPDCAVGRVGLEGLLALLAIFGIVSVNRRPRRRRASEHGLD
jgi:hypothetical protein